MSKSYIVYNPDSPALAKELIDTSIELSNRYGHDITYKIGYDGQSGNYIIRFFKDGKEIS